ncbi:MAG: sigma-54 dependent transcriptional regulator [Desulfobulbaceae bacterium]|nr:sigma-54 dependent transcriptional regulator [Desulfobulbaceae bacterium]HIJ79802.1 sigma-54-dependent Fis family transcriptional regulator [Deltaproteobacteria bacterium]
MGKVLLIDDSSDMLFSLSKTVKKEGFTVFTAASGAQALEILGSQIIDLIFLDIGLPDINGIDLISRIKKITGDPDIVMLTGMNDAKTAVEALKAGAIDYILKPFDLIEFKTILTRTMQARLLSKKVFLAQKPMGLEQIIGTSKEVLRLKEEIKTAAEVRCPVLITGETGTGKELVARAIHDRGGGNAVFIKVDCGTLSANLIESELFGYEKGAFTDAKADKKGLVEMADGGCLFLDEIGNLPLALQPILLRLIEESTFRKVGGVKDVHVNIKIIAATNVNLKQEIKQGTFREDLYYRLNVLQLKLPSLQERGDDVLLLANFFLRQFNRELNKQIRGFSLAAETAIRNYAWPGNIRELKNAIERAVIFCRNEWIDPQILNLNQPNAGIDQTEPTLLTLDQMTTRHIKRVLQATGHNKTRAAAVLDISRTTLRDKLKNDQSPAT